MFHSHSLNPRDVLKLHLYKEPFKCKLGLNTNTSESSWLLFMEGWLKKNRIPGYQWWCSAGSGGLGNGGYFFAVCLIQEWPGKYPYDVIGIKDMQNQQSCRNRWTRNSLSFAKITALYINMQMYWNLPACKALWEKSSLDPSDSFPFSCEVF